MTLAKEEFVNQEKLVNQEELKPELKKDEDNFIANLRAHSKKYNLNEDEDVLLG